MIALTVVLSVFVGVSLGLLGGGGSILTVPLLAYVAGVEVRQAMAMSLMVVGVTSAVGAVAHAREGRVRWRIAMVFGAAAMAGAYSGGRLAAFVPAGVLSAAFAVVMLGAGGAMLRGRRDDAVTEVKPVRAIRLAVLGVTVGALSGLVGAGGGFLLVPALSLVAGLPMPIAVGTSLAVISVQSLAGLVGHLADGQIDWRLGGLVTGAAVVGAVFGGRLVRYFDADALRRLFGWLVLMVASVILAKEVQPALGVAVGTLVVASLVCAHVARCPLNGLVTRRRLGMS